MILPGLIQLLLAEPTIAALVGENIYPVQLPTDSPMPAVTLQIVSGQSRPTLTTSGLQASRIQIDCFGESYVSADAVRTSIVKFLNMRSATLADGTWMQGAQLIQVLDYPYDWQPELLRLGAEFNVFYNFAA